MQQLLEFFQCMPIRLRQTYLAASLKHHHVDTCLERGFPATCRLRCTDALDLAQSSLSTHLSERVGGVSGVSMCFVYLQLFQDGLATKLPWKLRCQRPSRPKGSLRMSKCRSCKNSQNMGPGWMRNSWCPLLSQAGSLSPSISAMYVWPRA